MKRLVQTAGWVLLTAMLGTGCVHANKSYSLLEMPGQEKRFSEYCGDGYFVPYSKVVKKEGKRVFVTNPERAKNLGIGFAELELKPDVIYDFRVRFVGSEQINMHIFGTEYAGAAERWSRPWVSTVSFLNVNGVTEYRKQFAVSDGTTRVIPTLFLSSPRDMNMETLLMLEKLEIVPVGKMKHAAPEIRQINLARDCDFAKYPAGDFAPMHKGDGQRAVKAEVVKTPEDAALHLVRTAQNYIYPYIDLAAFPKNPRNHYVRVTVTAKGRGTFQTGLWWKRDRLEFDYENVGDCVLTDEWKTYTMTRPCLTPDVKGASLCFYSTNDGDYWIKDIKVNID